MATLGALASDPVLIGGDNRSGTTLTSVVLDSHPDLVVGPELDFVEPVNLGPYVVQACDLLLAGDSRVQGEGVETADPDWYFGVQFVKQCHRFGVPFDELRTLVAGVVADLGTDVADFDERCVVIDAVGEHRRRATGTWRPPTSSAARSGATRRSRRRRPAGSAWCSGRRPSRRTAATWSCGTRTWSATPPPRCTGWSSSSACAGTTRCC